MFWFGKTGISSKYSFSASPTFVTEPWSVYTGRPKDGNSTGVSKVSIFIFDKKRFEAHLLNYGIIKSRNSSHDRTLIAEAYDILKKQVSNLAKLKHPNILQLVEPLEEHSKNFMFVTEYVTGSLESVFTNVDEELNFFKGHVREDIVIQRGILEITQALDFIHNRASCVHMDVQPRSVFINDNSDWKVSGLGHLWSLPKGTNSAEYFMHQYDPRVPPFMHLELDYTAPEVVLDSTVSFKSDYFSLGSLILKLYTGKSFLSSENSSTQYKDEYAKFERRLAGRSWDGVLADLPRNLKVCMPKLLNRDLYERYDNISDFLQCDFFQDPLMKTLNYLDDLPTKDKEDRLLYLEGLVELLPKYPTTLLQRKFLTVLLHLLGQLCGDVELDSASISMDVHLVIRIGSTLSQLTFQERVLPVLADKSTFPHILHCATLPLVENLSTLKEKIKQDDFVQVILKPLLTYCFHEMKGELSVTVQEKLLEKMTFVTDVFDFLTVKSFLLPLLSELFSKTTSLTVKNACVSCFQLLIERKVVDSDLVCQDIIPLFQSMKTRDPRILMQSSKFFEIVPQIVKNEKMLVEQLLPLLWRYSLSPTLQTAQYSQYVQIINKLSSDLQKKHMEGLQKTDHSHEAKSARDFNKLIEPTSTGAPAEDADTKNANNISTPAIQPVRKNTPVAASRPATKVSNARTARFTEELPKRSQLTRPPRRPEINTELAADIDDFDEFVSASSPTSSQRAPSGSAGPPPSLNSLLAAQPPISNGNQTATKLNSLPPGFSLPLQPSKK
ncbi:BN860_16512g1_1 [Zygosaccharomyces bailii CLIB 213]|uniref:BN860_16512g1_1 n=1 Tax=Zygosaccharomyces bailii (strain CLIB 213 / ATCC 58445 / CBS 680 / BCRC 21525 / NBRC 1098 / NCYC 1416 / NRRL Y-2227) TaxID=1333698 RepID=A0A8J2X6G3_ZYGB2|nr:BN860_16512g1_1 [Zygosaccharomyces bailii CLIB 213]